MGTATKTVAVLGGGIAGLTAAQELRQRGYRVTVFEKAGSKPEHLGGKARSFAEDDPTNGPMFGEHGFRFFPGFYRNVIDTMESILDIDGRTVASRLHQLPKSCFYARSTDGAANRAESSRSGRLIGGLQRAGATARRFGVWLFFGWLLAAGWFVWHMDASNWLRAVWFAFPLIWFVSRTVAFALKPANGNTLPLDVPGPRPRDKPAIQRWLISHRWWRAAAPVLAIVGIVLLLHGAWPTAAVVFIVAGVVQWYPVLATVRYLWSILQDIPAAVRPGILESVAASLKIVCIVAACERRRYRQWERDSWWSYIGAYRYSRAFELAFATGLTRSFVATRAEQMSARTGATILAQLLYDVSPTLVDRAPADRVLNAPTHDAWITPWINQLRKCGVRFNEFNVNGSWVDVPSVEVVALLPAGDHSDRVGGFWFVDGSPDGEGRSAPEVFDHYVLAVSGTGAQRILANSPDILAQDRSLTDVGEIVDPLPGAPDERPLPYLDGIFDLEFGWMTGVVYHLRERVELPEAHHLCLESEWALTAIDVAPIWKRGKVERGPWQTIISVNISDWSSPSSHARPARFESLEGIRHETWRQLCEHVDVLQRVPGVPPFVPDRAITDPDHPGLGKVASFAGDNLSLVNDETLLINTAGSWAKRPTAQTAFRNLVLAGDYVRTLTDFASMEAANEAAKRAVNVVLARDGSAERCAVHGLPIPKALEGSIRVVSALDRVAYLLGFPHPLMLLATPIGWFARSEQLVQRGAQRARRWWRDRRETPRQIRI